MSTNDPYADELVDLFAQFNLPGDPRAEKALTHEIERRGLHVESTQRVADSPDGEASYAAHLVDQNGVTVAHGIGAHPRQATIYALLRFLEGKH